MRLKSHEIKCRIEEDSNEESTIHTPRGHGRVHSLSSRTKATEDKWMECINDGDTEAQHELLSQGHLFPVADGAKVKITEVDVSRHIFKVRVFGSTREGWIINECLTDVVEPKG
jgi:hypothetical protein